MKHVSWILLGLVLGPLTACFPTPETTGALGNGGFTYSCTGGGDAMCRRFDGDATPPSQIAVGSRFGLFYTPDSSQQNKGSGTPTVVAASPAMASFQDTSFTAATAGQSAFLARRDDGTVVDFLMIDLVPVDHFEVPTGLELAMLGSSSVTVTPQSVAGETIGGSLSYVWSSSPDNVVNITPSGNTAQIVGVSPGTAEVTVQAGGAISTFAVTVLGGAP
jgi:hypothetical protein